VSMPVIAIRSAQSRVAIRDGQTIVIGGLMEDRITESVDKVPILGDIPLVGALFRHTVKNKSKTELLIFLTPHVAQAPEDLAGMSEQETAGTKLLPGAVDKGVFKEHMEGMRRGAASRPAGQDQPYEGRLILPPSASQPQGQATDQSAPQADKPATPPPAAQEQTSDQPNDQPSPRQAQPVRISPERTPEGTVDATN
jgi:Flp pilus assembly secretin CpaC